MTSYGKNETEKLKENLENQLDRLVQQLDDLESCKDELDAAEYEETKQDTIEQLKEFNENLSRVAKGDVSLISSLGAMQLATQAAISQAFRTPEVIRLFGRREPVQLREKLKEAEQEFKLGKTSETKFLSIKAEILSALHQLSDKLTVEELQFLEQHQSSANNLKKYEFQEVADD